MELHTIGDDLLQIEISPLGARLNALTFDGLDRLVDGAATRTEALGPKKYHGAVVGPVANRIAGAQATIDGRDCTFESNERDITTLHSGSTGVHARDWTVEAKDKKFVSLSLALADGDGGFPGNRVLIANFEVIETALHVHFEAETDAPTGINLALHPYWTLAQNGREGQKLRVRADTYLPVTDVQIPTGEIADVSGTLFDLRTLALPSKEIDHNYCLSDAPGPAIVVETDKLRMEVETDAPGVQIFTGKAHGIAIEPQHWPDAMHHPHFPSVRLNPGETYTQNSTYRFTRL
ncbi:MAG: galactose mutarotase [Silicimonas sp.]|nr:galactose mutarotase [Silicimonas sp.]